MISFLKNRERFKFALIILGFYFLTTLIWKELFGIFHYLIPFLGVLGAIYSGVTGWISFMVAYLIALIIFKRKHGKMMYVFLTSIFMRVIVSLLPYAGLFNYLYPLMMIYLLDAIQILEKRKNGTIPK